MESVREDIPTLGGEETKGRVIYKSEKTESNQQRLTISSTCSTRGRWLNPCLLVTSPLVSRRVGRVSIYS